MPRHVYPASGRLACWFSDPLVDVIEEGVDAAIRAGEQADPRLMTRKAGAYRTERSSLAVIGVFDLLNAAKASTTDPQWLGFYDEAYLFAAAIYFAICFAGSRYSLWLEGHLRRG